MQEGVIYDKIEDKFEVTAYGADKTGRHIIVFIQQYPPTESGPPFYWTGEYRSGHEFTTLEEARSAIKGATLSYNVSAVDKASIQVLQYSVMMKKETKYIGVVKD